MSSPTVETDQVPDGTSMEIDQVFATTVAQTYANETELAAVNQYGAAQAAADRRATDDTTTAARYNRFHEEYSEFCHLVFNDNPETPTYNTDRIYNFLLYHAYRPKKVKPQRVGKRKGKRKSRSRSNPPQPRLPPNRYPKWFEHVEYTKVMKNLDESAGNPSAIDLSGEAQYIGFTHLNNMKCGLADHAPQEVKNQLVRDTRVKDLLRTVKSRNCVQSRLRGEEKTAADLPHWELLPSIIKLESLFWNKNSNSKNPAHVCAALRDRWCFNDSLQCIVRSESLWKEELSDMQHFTHKVESEPDAYEVLARILWEGKTNQSHTGQQLLGQCFRHRDPKKCAIGSKAFYLFARFRITQEQFDFTDKEWFKVKTAIAVGDTGNRGERNWKAKMGSGTYKDALAVFQDELNIHTGKQLHIGRKFGVYIPQLDGVSDTQTMSLGNWAFADGVVFQKHYSARVPWEAMRSCAGCGARVGRYYLPRSRIQVTSDALLKSVWPSLEEAKERFFEVDGNTRFTTAWRFIAAMDYMRVVLLQDAAFFLTQCPDRAGHAIFSDPIFHTAEFLDYKERFAREYQHLTLPVNDPTVNHLQYVVPRIGDVLENVLSQGTSCNGLLSDIGQALSHEGEKAHEERQHLFNLVYNGFRRMENNYLQPIFNDVNFIATFFRAGVNGSLGMPHLPTRTSTGAGAEFHEIVTQRLLANSQVTPRAPGRESTGCPTVTPENTGDVNSDASTDVHPQEDTRCPPPGPDDFRSLLEMYHGWVGYNQREKSIRLLFADPSWRSKYCPKSSSALKRCQRMSWICEPIDQYLELKGIDSSSDFSSEEMDVAVLAFEKEVFEDKVPDKFTWSKYVKFFREHKNRQI